MTTITKYSYKTRILFPNLRLVSLMCFSLDPMITLHSRNDAVSRVDSRSRGKFENVIFRNNGNAQVYDGGESVKSTCAVGGMLVEYGLYAINDTIILVGAPYTLYHWPRPMLNLAFQLESFSRPLFPPAQHVQVLKVQNVI